MFTSLPITAALWRFIDQFALFCCANKDLPKLKKYSRGWKTILSANDTNNRRCHPLKDLFMTIAYIVQKKSNQLLLEDKYFLLFEKTLIENINIAVPLKITIHEY